VPVARPSWCTFVARGGPTLVIAPHGGLSARDLLAAETAGTLRGNDLHTAAVAADLAERLDGSLIANVAVDRNELDLNRIDEVAAAAGWFFDLMAEQVERLLARHPVAQVLVVHGWHVVQPRCDVGVGARLERAADAHAAAPRLTVAPEHVCGALDRLRLTGERHGIHTTFGERWPGAHRNNVLQLFRRRSPVAPGAHALARLAASGRVQAVQLELGTPLRWPGPWRERFLAAASEALALPGRAGTEAAHRAPSARDARARADDAVPPVRASALQAHDPASGRDGLGIVVGLGPISRDELGARLLLFPGGQRMLLFTGHARIATGSGRVGGLVVERGDDRLAVRFRGPVLDVPDASRYFRDEAAQLDAGLLDLDLTLCWRGTAGGAFGAVEGRARLGDATWDVATHGFTDPVLGRPAPAGRGGLRLTAALAAPGEAASGLLAELGADGGVLRELGAAGEALRESAAVPSFTPPAATPGVLVAPFTVPLGDGRELLCEPRGHVTILRPAGAGSFARITFGSAGFAFAGGRCGTGFYEHTSVLTGRDQRHEEP
jgi:hypothetical protein